MQAASAALGLGSGLFSMFSGLKSVPKDPGIAPAMSIMAGQQQQQADRTEADALSQQSVYALRDSLLQASQNDYQVQRTKADQDAQFSASGVTLAGSPLAVLTETQMLGDQVSNQIKQRGQLQSMLLSEQGLQYLRQGSAAAFAGLADALNYNYQQEVQRAQAKNAAVGAGINGIAAGLGMFAGRGGSGSRSSSSGGFGPAPLMSMNPAIQP